MNFFPAGKRAHRPAPKIAARTIAIEREGERAAALEFRMRCVRVRARTGGIKRLIATEIDATYSGRDISFLITMLNKIYFHLSRSILSIYLLQRGFTIT